MMALAGGGIGQMGAAPRLSPEYYTHWRKETAEKIAKGEDPYADFAKRARERSDSSWVAKMMNSAKKMFRKDEGKEESKGEVVR